MYERNAIVLERYLNKIFEQKNGINFKNGLETLKEIIEETKKYIDVTIEEEKIIKEFEELAKKMQLVQKKQEELCLSNIKNEEEKNKLFSDLDNDPKKTEKKLIELEEKMTLNFEEEKKIREKYVEYLNEFFEKQEKRNRCDKEKRIEETAHVKLVNEVNEKLSRVDEENVEKISEFIKISDETLCETLEKVMLNNGKNEKIKFDENVIKKAVNKRIVMAKKEAECYLLVYSRLKKLMSEIENDNFKINKYEKTLRDCAAKLNFLNAEKEYISNFLDNERMASINGENVHKEMMIEACKKFDIDIKQIENLYQLILREVANRSAKKAYKELYNASYLTKIEETERNFNEEVHSIKANIGTIINTNYWRIDGIKNIYEVFNNEVQERFEVDLSEFLPVQEENVVEIDEKDSINQMVNEEEDNNYELDNNKEVIIEKQEKEQYEEDYDEDEEWFISNEELQRKEEERKIEIEDEDDVEDEDEDEDEKVEEDIIDNFDLEDFEMEDEFDLENYEDDDEDEYEDEYEEDDEEYEEDEEEEQFDLEENLENEIEKIHKEEKNNEENEDKKTSGIFSKIFKDKKK